ncbi:MAG: helix-turn-helix transcriptional regulator [Micrococcales bacterium]
MSWTFLSNHGHVVIQIAKNPDIKLTDLASLVGVTERHARAIVNDLREAGYIEINKAGRRNTYRVNAKKPLRHVAEADHTLKQLLQTFQV